MPNAETGNTVAYVPVAHGVVPWWAEAYASQKKGDSHILINSWFQARVDGWATSLLYMWKTNLYSQRKSRTTLKKGTLVSSSALPRMRRSGSPPTITGFPLSSELSTCSTETKKTSKSI